TIGKRLDERLQKLNSLLRGWCNFYRHAWGAKRVFYSLDHYAWWTIFRWLRKKHNRISGRVLAVRDGCRRPSRRSVRWCPVPVKVFEAGSVPVRPFKLGGLRPPDFV